METFEEEQTLKELVPMMEKMEKEIKDQGYNLVDGELLTLGNGIDITEFSNKGQQNI